jgi:hypothetical protein
VACHFAWLLVSAYDEANLGMMKTEVLHAELNSFERQRCSTMTLSSR